MRGSCARSSKVRATSCPGTTPATAWGARVQAHRIRRSRTSQFSTHSQEKQSRRGEARSCGTRTVIWFVETAAPLPEFVRKNAIPTQEDVTRLLAEHSGNVQDIA